MNQEELQERRQREAQLAKANLRHWEQGGGCLFAVGFTIVGILFAVGAGLAHASLILDLSGVVLWVGSFVGLSIPLFMKVEQLKQAWFSAYGTEVIATITAQREVPTSAGGPSYAIQLTWSHPTGGEALSFWETVAEAHLKKYPLGRNVCLRYDPTDLAFHRIYWQRPVLS
jgi:hypothetical protein